MTDLDMGRFERAVQLQGFAVRMYGLLEPPCLGQCVAEVEPAADAVRVRRDGVLAGLDRFAEALLVLQCNAQVAPGRPVVGVEFQCFAVTLFGPR
jgi:hypothetical protein